MYTSNVLGTLVLGYWLKDSDISDRLKLPSSRSFLSSSGSKFLTSGLATENARRPSVLHWCRRTSSWRRCASSQL